ncbi:hypothetical protein SAMN05660866_03557 [Maribacter arcticus]|uniref:Uncharacterized protein n=1 Tax=Maribacter arcticus TaxID=561365 RepID=A0A1T5EKF1_9FLAO|nr:hypothetical protein SAMN05660866_03557 [Maribacter arcticus]|tara:strand:+ start:477 stop:638 length:162 start_codon:yes stop_codon:yes gene_type:complete
MKNLQYARVGAVRAKAYNSNSTNNHQGAIGFVDSFKSSANKLFDNTLNNISCK